MCHKKLESTWANAGILAQGDYRYVLVCWFYSLLLPTCANANPLVRRNLDLA
jgi:hypothetical protein